MIILNLVSESSLVLTSFSLGEGVSSVYEISDRIESGLCGRIIVTRVHGLEVY